MKSIIIIGDGMSDWPIDRLGGKTPLEVAKKPHIDKIAKLGRMGTFITIPQGQPKGSAVANLSVLGYDPRETFEGRAVLEAANMGVDLADDDVAIRTNLIHIDDGRIKNHSAGHITSEEGAAIVRSLNESLGKKQGRYPVEFHPGVGYRHLCVLKNGWGSPKIKCAPPHDHVGELTSDLQPRALAPEAEETAARLKALYDEAMPILEAHPINQNRQKEGKDTANAIWFWSPGRPPSMKTLEERFGIKGAVISAVDLVMGLGVYAGMEVIKVPGATGLWDTNYEGKAAAALEALQTVDLVYVHVEATDEAGHARDLDLKVKCIEQLDDRLVRPILDGLEQRGIQATVSILPDHPTPVETGSHATDPVPFAIYNPTLEPDDTTSFDEKSAAKGALGTIEGETFIRYVLGK